MKEKIAIFFIVCLFFVSCSRVDTKSLEGTWLLNSVLIRLSESSFQSVTLSECEKREKIIFKGDRFTSYSYKSPNDKDCIEEIVRGAYKHSGKTLSLQVAGKWNDFELEGAYNTESNRNLIIVSIVEGKRIMKIYYLVE